MPKTRVAVVGLGLLGGSIGLALSRSAGPWHVIGVDRDEGTVGKAIAAGAVDAGTTDIGQGVHDADLVVFATPVRDRAGSYPHRGAGYEKRRRRYRRRQYES